MNFPITARSRTWFALSGAAILASLLVMRVWGLRPGIDFVGGSLWELRGRDVTVSAIHDALRSRGEGDAQVQSSGEGSVVVRLRHVRAEEHEALLAALRETLPDLEELRFDTVGPTFSRELFVKAVFAIVLSAFGILAYLAFAFRRTTSVVSPWAFGAIAVIALLHDLIITAGFFAAYARFFHASADSLFVTALLTTIGFSVHDTIVIFNRVKTNLRRTRLPFPDTVETSVFQTLTRSINTSVTTLLVLFALLFFGGTTIRPFLVTLSAGIVVGSYSSIFIAAPLLVRWQGRRRR